MKHSTFLKFVCIVLCAASLLGLAASGFGLYAMVELDLYNRTVDQYVSDLYESNAQQYARVTAQQYASEVLGGCPETLALDQYGNHWGFPLRFDEGGFGYAIFDGEGNELTGMNPEVKDYRHISYSFPVEGNYMHFVSAQQAKNSTLVEPVPPSAGETSVIDNLSENMAPVYFIHFSYPGGSEGIGSPDPLGYLERYGNGSVNFVSYEAFNFQISGDVEATKITFMDRDESILYEVSAGEAVAVITQSAEGGHNIHLLSPNGGTGTPIYKAIFYGEDLETPIEMLGSAQPIGAAFLDENGMLNFQLYIESANLKNATTVRSMVLMDQDGTILFGQAQPQLQTGTPTMTNGGLTFTSDPTAVAVEMPTQAASAEGTDAEATMDALDELQAQSPEEATEASTEETASKELGEPTAQADGEESASIETIPVETMPPETVPPETIPVTVVETEPTEPAVLINGKPLSEYDTSTYQYYDEVAQQWMDAKVVYLTMPELTVEVFIREGADRNSQGYQLMRLLKQYNSLLVPVLLASLMVLALTTVYLCVAAGHRRTGEIKAGGLNRIPLDLYTLLSGGAIFGLGALAVVTVTDLLPRNLQISLVLFPLLSYSIALIFVGYCFAWVSQCKTPGGYWWRNSLCGRLLTGGVGSLGKGMGWTRKKFFPWLWRVVCGFWDICLVILQTLCNWVVFLWKQLTTLIKKLGNWLFAGIRRVFAMLPVTWQWMLGGLTLLLMGLLVWANRRDGWGVLWLVVGFGLVLYVSQCFGILLGAAKRMNKGDLETKINDKRMIGCFKEFAEDLNNLADVVIVAAQKQLRSERMKTELITNVSHDIKTPLTSIINYVDLMQKPHTEEEGKEYLEVLDRQSQRLKKLIDDLMDMSKANTGNMHVEISRLDAVESVNQALGEFADKLEKAELTPVFRHNTGEAFIMADGKLLWRVLSNLLGNAVKYAMPGTRLYLDMMNLDGRVILSIKNISRDELNIDSEELMERFVRGDDSRNTDGSGLGLNIAKSLMELQKGHLQLLVDGDLFKVTLVFPTAE